MKNSTPNERVQTLPGLGPRITHEHLHAAKDAALIEGELQRYLWWRHELAQTIFQRSILEWFEVLRVDRTRAPGELEAALVALSVYEDDLAAVALEWFTPPENLRTFHTICRLRRSELRDTSRSS